MKIDNIIFNKNIHKKIIEKQESNNIVDLLDFYIKEFYQNIEIDSDYSTFEKNFLNYISSNKSDIEKYSEQIKDKSEKLSSNINEATKAIENSDSKKLNDILKDIENMKKELEELNNELYTDELTKCYNRKYLKKILNVNDRFKSSGTFAIIDFDKFKYINDTFGHVTGDKVLITISKIINKAIEKNMDKNTKLVRYGGDEFFIIHYGNNGDVLNNLLKNIQKKLQTTEFTESSKEIKFNSNFSFGITDFEKGQNFQEVLEESDKYLYRQKEERKLKGLR